MYRIVIPALFIVSAGLLLSTVQPQADGCAAVPRRGDTSIHIAEESAIIVWDPVKKVEHFIRRAVFDAKSPDFGFLVPTPSTPQLPLTEVEDRIFTAAESWQTPRVVIEKRFKFEPLLCCFGFATKSSMVGKSAPDKEGVRVLHEQKVGGYETAVLEADNTSDLSNWLSKNGYSNDPELQSWLAPYVAGKWKITAFKISKDPATGGLATTKAVRMSFATERPFFPYREPEKRKDETKAATKNADKSKDETKTTKNDESPRKQGQPNGRLLRVIFVSDVRMEGKLGTNVWHAKPRWSDALTEDQRRHLVTEIGVAEDVPAKAWMTTFDDLASPRPGTDEVYFEPSSDPSPIRPRVVHYNDVWIPSDVVILGVIALIGAFLVARLIWKKRAGAE